MFKLLKYYPADRNPQRFWDDKYAQEHIAGKNSEEFRQQGFWPLLKRYLPRDQKCLDAGCGIGGWILFLREEGYNVEGIDIAPRTIRALAEYDPDIKVKEASITAIPYPDNFFGGVLAVGTLEYIEDNVPLALREAHRVLKPGGIFFIEVPVINWLRRLLYLPLKQIEGVIKKQLNKTPCFSNYLFDRQELKTQLDQAGFDIVAEQPHELPETDSHFGLYVDWKIMRGRRPYQLNLLGIISKKLANAISPWVASTGIVVVARKR